MNRIRVPAILWLLLTTISASSADSVGNVHPKNGSDAPAQHVIGVGGYDFPPYVREKDGKFSGLTLDLIAMLNAFQSKYRFEFVPTSSMRRYDDFENRAYDVIFFENVDWGWKEMPVDVSRDFARDGEVFTARNLPGRTQEYFDVLKGKSLLVYLGYHYPFARYDTAPERLLSKFNARTTVSHEANIRSVLAGRADLAVVTRSFLAGHLRNRPAEIPRLLVSQRIEQDYRHTVLVRKNIEPSIGELNGMIDRMEDAGYLSILLGKYGICTAQDPSCYPPQGHSAVTDIPVKQTAKRVVKVGGYHFPPYVEHIRGSFVGLTPDLLELMNAFQSSYHFEFVPTTPLSRHKDFADRSFDVVFFERKEWGWDAMPVDRSREFLGDAEVYVTSAAAHKGQDYFRELGNKSKLGYWGYHYPSAGFTTDADVLLKLHKMRLTTSHEDNIRAVLDGRAHVAIVTRSFVIRFLREHPALIPRLLVSDGIEQEYRHTILTRKGLSPSPDEIMEILAQLDKLGYSRLLWGKYDVTAIPENR
ncbi:MAG: transporter substrate-binding domain-containing protein [Pseudomonadota bacterium]